MTNLKAQTPIARVISLLQPLNPVSGILAVMPSQTKKFHFQEIDWVISFPAQGNRGKYRDYSVVILEHGEEKFSELKSLKLGEVLDRIEIDLHYPHTVGYYKTCSGQEANYAPDYLELRVIRTVEEFWAFLNAANL